MCFIYFKSGASKTSMVGIRCTKEILRLQTAILDHKREIGELNQKLMEQVELLSAAHIFLDLVYDNKNQKKCLNKRKCHSLR